MTAKVAAALGCLLLATVLLLGCATDGEGAAGAESRAVTSDGLEKTDVSGPGVLYIKPDHNIGGYDQIHFEPIAIAYKRGRRALRGADEATLRETLMEGMRERASAADIPIVSAPEPCAMSMRFYVVDLELVEIRGAGAQSIVLPSMGKVTLVVDIRDSRSGEALMRFAQRRQLEGGAILGGARAAQVAQLRRSLDSMLADFGAQLVEVIPRSSVQEPLSPECTGRFRAIADAQGAAPASP